MTMTIAGGGGTGTTPNMYAIEVASGKVSEAVSQTMFGYATGLPLVTTLLLWQLLTDYTFLTSAQSLEIVSDNANDTAAGTGARTVLVQTLDANYAKVNTVVTLNGATPVALPGTHLFFNDAILLTSGSGHVNAGNLTIRVAGGGTNQGYMAAGFGHALNGLFTVPAGKIWVVQNFFAASALIGNAAAGCRLLAGFRDSAGSLVFGLPQHLTSNGPTMVTLPVPFAVPEKTTFFAKVDNASTVGVSASFGCTGILRAA